MSPILRISVRIGYIVINAMRLIKQLVPCCTPDDRSLLYYNKTIEKSKCKCDVTYERCSPITLSHMESESWRRASVKGQSARSVDAVPRRKCHDGTHY